MENRVKTFKLSRFENAGFQDVTDTVTIEEPLEIQILTGSERETQPLSVTMRTPGNDMELAVGFLITEGIIKKREDFVAVEMISVNVVRVSLSPSLVIDQSTLSRNFYTTSSCGVCGKTSIDAISIKSNSLESDLVVNYSVIQKLSESLNTTQPLFQSTGSIHASALFDREGNLTLIQEDVGRHNALDKIIGKSFMDNHFPLSRYILLVSGRTSFELIQKSVVAGIPIVAAIGAPSSLAIELAQEKGVTLVGFLKKDRFNIYTHKNRIQE